LQVALGLPTFVGEDMAALRALARANLGIFPNLPFFRRLLRASGFAAEADLAEQGRAEAALSDRVLEAICLMGPLSRCRQRLAEYRDAGVDLPILWPAVDFESARATVQAFCQ
jgi:alkanesulfonate monooxygenase SsuD/methylene tetrahydromethanopterin reductase-like flavin-dependent oxidoreductase (luciferase family)